VPRELRYLPVFIMVMVIGAISIDIANGRFWTSDFRVYHDAAEALLHGDPVYGVAFGEDTGFYKYSPAVALLFVPATLLPFQVAAVIHVLLIGAALVLSMVAMERLLMRHVHLTYAPRMVLRAALLLLCILVLLARELHLGNINLWLVCGAVLATEALLDGRRRTAGMLFGILWSVKPYLLLMIIPLVVRKERGVLFTAAITMLVGLLLPALFLGPLNSLHLHEQWLQAMAAHSGYLHSPDTVKALLARWVHPGFARVPFIAFVALAAGCLALLTWCGMRLNDGQSRTRQALEPWLAFAVVPNLVITDQEHFLFALPLIAFALSVFFIRSSAWAGLFVLAMVGYATRSSDLWGGALETTLAEAGLLGMGGLLLISVVVRLYLRRSSAGEEPG
jgi:Glycosyltransferase family 87